MPDQPTYRPVHKALHRPLTVCGVDRRLFFLALLMGGATFNLFYSFWSGMLVFLGLYGFALWATNRDPDMLRIVIASSGSRRRYDPGKHDRLDDAFIYKESIDLGTYERQRDRLREELTLVEIDRHGSKVEEFDVEGILNFAERVLPRASDLWIQASLEQRQRLQRLFFPEGVAFSGKSFDRTVVTSSLFEYLRPLDGSNENLVDQTGIEPVTS